MKTYLTKRSASKSLISQVRRRLRGWAEDQDLKFGPKTLLIHLTDHADVEARVYVASRRFQKLMAVSPRSITSYLRALEADDHISPTGDFVVQPCAKLTLYRLAPDVGTINEILAEEFSELRPEQVGKEHSQIGNLRSQPSNPRGAYKEPYISSNKLERTGMGDGDEVASPAPAERPAPAKPFDSLIPAMEYLAPELVDEFFGDNEDDRIRSYLRAAFVCQQMRMLRPWNEKAHAWFATAGEAFVTDAGLTLGATASKPGSR